LNIDRRLDIIREAWEIVVEAGVIAERVQALKDHLQEDLWNDEHFYKNTVSMFVVRISIMDDLVRRKQELPSKSRLKQIQVGWLVRIDVLQHLSATCDSLMKKKSSLFLKALDVIKELEGPLLIKESKLLNKDQVETKLRTQRTTSGVEFDDLENFLEE